MPSNPLKVIAFRDNRAGHLKQTQGILDALSRLTAIDVHDCQLPNPGFKSAVKDWARYGAAFAGATPDPVPGVTDLPPDADLCIGTGSRTHVPMILYKKRHPARIVTCMTPDPPLGRHMDLMMAPEHDSPRAASNVLTTLGPPNTAPARGVHDPHAGLVLVGGVDDKTHQWDSSRVLEQVRSIVDKAPETNWTLSSSPRTPEDLAQNLAELAQNTPNADFYHFKDTPSGWVEEQYGKSLVAWVTADSVSMVYEALTAGCRVGVVPVDWKNPDNKLARGLAALFSRNLVKNLDDWLEGSDHWPDAEPLDEAGRCAREILARFWPERLTARAVKKDVPSA